MSRSELEYLRHILDEAMYLSRTSSGVILAEFLRDETLKRAFARSIEIIGEATKKVSTDVRERYPHVEWRAMAAMRDHLIHGYFGVDYEIVWDVASNKAAQLADAMSSIIIQEEQRRD